MSAVLEAHEPNAKYLSARQPRPVQHFELLGTVPGGVAKLRELILTLAVQGKLVPQDPSDEPASELLKRIRSARERQISEGKAKRGKPLAELTEDVQPFAIPEKWCWVNLGEITNYGSPVKAGALLPDTWVLDMEDIEKSSGRLIQRLRFSERPAVSDKNSFTKGEVLYGKLRPYLNKVLVADEDGVCTTEIIPFRCYGEYEPGYFRLALSSPFSWTTSTPAATA
jgi:type I restriction enzyme S subunit